MLDRVFTHPIQKFNIKNLSKLTQVSLQAHEAAFKDQKLRRKNFFNDSYKKRPRKFVDPSLEAAAAGTVRARRFYKNSLIPGISTAGVGRGSEEVELLKILSHTINTTSVCF